MLESTSDPVERLPLLVEAGLHDEARELARDLGGPGVEENRLRAAFAVQAFGSIGEWVAAWDAATLDPMRRGFLYEWWFTVDDRASVDRETARRMADGSAQPVDVVTRGRLEMDLLRPDEAERVVEPVLRDAAAGARETAAAELVLSRVEFKRRNWDGAFAHASAALEKMPLDADVLMQVAQVLIRLGRTDEAITACELAVEVAPYHEMAHYMLGNGYARKNYTQLFEAYPDAFVVTNEHGRKALDLADQVAENGSLDKAVGGYEALLISYPDQADVLARLGSLEFLRGNLPEARRRFLASLAICPEYGRAHNGLAKVLEAERLAVEVHRPDYEAAFAALAEPMIPNLGEFVVNVASQSDRHHKMVALAVDPWARFLPALLEGELTFYIKPLHELLSETPGTESLRDLRITYDSRLWDDVRGCGGYHTVTGVEDVERTILNRYNTVLHELTHQVHGVLPAARKRQIEELYRQTKERDEQTGDAFLSRYAGGSVWEYFAEGANALYSPRRDEYDTREIVRERLLEKDPALADLVREIMTEASVESCYAVAYAGRGDERLQEGKIDAAVESYELAVKRSPSEEDALGSLVYALNVAGRSDDALDWAGTAAMRVPESGALAVGRASVLWHGGNGLDAARALLEDARETVREEDRHEVDQAIGGYAWIAGDAAGARAAYERVLERQGDDPNGLWGLASAQALAGDFLAAWETYGTAVEHRTGVVELRADFARDLLRAGEVDRAEEQVSAGLLLDPEDPDLLALRAWIELERGQLPLANASSAEALRLGPWSDWAVVVRSRVLAAEGRDAEAEEMLAPLRARIASDAPPEFIYQEKWGRYREIHTLPATLRELVGS